MEHNIQPKQPSMRKMCIRDRFSTMALRNGLKTKEDNNNGESEI